MKASANINHLWARLLVEELVRQGVGLFVVCPGSRSTPLAVAVAENQGAESLVHWDERAAAFVALGWGRATGRPAAVITTSGTAVANLLPAAVEADADGVPLLLITADRPPELRETGANQTVRQPPIFQDVARWTLDWPVPTTDVPARWVLSTAAHAVHRARRPAGPVHLNLPFREPLAATPDGTDAAAYLADVNRWVEAETYRGGPYPNVLTSSSRPSVRGDLLDVDVLYDWNLRVHEMASESRGVIVLGAGATDEFLASMWAERAARRLKWPILPDVLSGLRTGTSARSPYVPEYDLLLTSESASGLAPRAVLHVGGRPTSKRLLRFLEDARPELYLRITPSPVRSDPNLLATHVATGSVSRALEWLAGGPEAQAPEGGWVGRWREASGAAWKAVRPRLRSGLSEPAVANALTRTVQHGRTLVVAASMPIRDLDAFADRSGRSLRVIANRGASGIDGTIATARGVGRGVMAFVGDLALLHDLTSLALLRDISMTVVVVNNDGGGIFHRLPVAHGQGALAVDTFERMFGTPHGLGFADAARQFGLAYHAPDTLPAFEAALDAARQSGASALIEVRTDRHEQAEIRRQLEAAAAAAVDATLA